MVRSDEPSPGSTRGQAVTLTAVVLWVVAGTILLLGVLTDRAVGFARAQSAADAAALAGAHGPEAAATVAGANGAVIVASFGDAAGIQLEVELGGAHARARAVRERFDVWPMLPSEAVRPARDEPCHQLRIDYPVDFPMCQTTPTR